MDDDDDDDDEIGPMPLPPRNGGRKRPRLAVASVGGLDHALDRLETMLNAKDRLPIDAQALLEAMRRLGVLQGSVEKRLAACTIDSLTPHEAVEFIYRRKVRLHLVTKNDFEEEDSSDDNSESGGTVEPVATKEAKAAKRASPKSLRQLVANFHIARVDRLEVSCSAERPPKGSTGEARYALEVHLLNADKKGALLLRCESSSQEACCVNWEAWQALRGRIVMDQRPVADVARGVVVLGVLGELRRKFAKQESEGEDEASSLVSTVAVCGMMADALLPTAEGRLITPQARVADALLPTAEGKLITPQATEAVREAKEVSGEQRTTLTMPTAAVPDAD